MCLVYYNLANLANYNKVNQSANDNMHNFNANLAKDAAAADRMLNASTNSTPIVSEDTAFATDASHV